MIKRAVQRYDAGLLMEDLTKVSLVFPGKQVIESSLINISSQGVRVSIPAEHVPRTVPQPNETVDIIFPTIQLHLSSRCIYSMHDQDNFMMMGFYVFDPADQDKLRCILDRID